MIFDLLFTFMSFQDLEALALTDKMNYNEVKQYLQNNWIRFLSHLHVHTTVINQLNPGHILIHYDPHLLITGCLNSGTSLIQANDGKNTITATRILSGHSVNGDHFYLEASNNLFQLSQNEATLVQSQVKMVSTTNRNIAYLQCNNWLSSINTLYKPPSPLNITCIAFPWVGYEDGSILNIHDHNLLNPSTLSASVLCIATSRDLVVSGHANGSITINGRCIKVSNTAISALCIVKSVILVGSADGILHCYALESQCVEWATRQLDISPIMQITATRSSINISTFSLVIKIHYPQMHI